MKKFLIFRTDRVGDFILSCILIKSIKRNEPSSEITVICSDQNFEYVKSYSLVDNAKLYPKKFIKISEKTDVQLFFLMRKTVLI